MVFMFPFTMYFSGMYLSLILLFVQLNGKYLHAVFQNGRKIVQYDKERGLSGSTPKECGVVIPTFHKKMSLVNVFISSDMFNLFDPG